MLSATMVLVLAKARCFCRALQLVVNFFSLRLAFLFCGRLFYLATAAWSTRLAYSTVTDFAKFRGLSTSVPRASAV
jgi:hypothetical protein